MEKNLLAAYRNGNCFVYLYEDGTKVRLFSKEADPSFPECIDLKITSYCDVDCPFCHESASIEGTFCDFSLPFFNTLVHGTELAIGGGNPLSHPQLESFLWRMKEKGIICNLTLRQNHLFSNLEKVQSFIDKKLLYGIGISYINLDEKLLSFCHKNKNALIHLILGIHGKEVLDSLSDKELKVLLLGYKRFGRGKEFYAKQIDEKIKEVKSEFFDYVPRFKVISLDNAAIEQLDLRKKISKRDFKKHFMGEEGSFTMYIDAVKKEFAINSIAEKNNRYPLKEDIKQMFKAIRRQYEIRNTKQRL